MRKTYTTADGPGIIAQGSPMIKKPNPVYLLRQTEAFSCITNEGEVEGNAGDFIAHDPMSGHVWPVTSEYVDMHYQAAVPQQQAQTITQASSASP